jgi:hypothetical protein
VEIHLRENARVDERAVAAGAFARRKIEAVAIQLEAARERIE